MGNGDGTLAAVLYSGVHTGSTSGYSAALGDFNGDGVSDMLWERATGSGVQARVSLAETPLSYGRVAWIASDFGPGYRLDYAPLTHDAVYTKDTGGDGCDLPCMDLQAPLHVLKELSRDYGSGVIHRRTYRYGGGKGNLEGRGFLGFRWIEAKDEETGVFNSMEYRQDFPYIGRMSASSRFLADGTALSTEENTWSTMSLNNGKTKFPHISRKVAESYEIEDGPGNAPVKAVTTTSAYDGYGNPTSMTAATAGAGGTFTKTTTNTYKNDSAKWHLGRLTCASVAWSTPGQSTQTRKSGFAYDATTGLLNKEVIEPRTGDIAGCVSSAAGTGVTLVTSHQHDGYGNRIWTVVSGPGVTTRTTNTKWGERAADGTVTFNGRFAVEVTNALGHVEKRWHDDGHGSSGAAARSQRAGPGDPVGVRRVRKAREGSEGGRDRDAYILPAVFGPPGGMSGGRDGPCRSGPGGAGGEHGRSNDGALPGPEGTEGQDRDGGVRRHGDLPGHPLRCLGPRGSALAAVLHGRHGAVDDDHVRRDRSCEAPEEPDGRRSGAGRTSTPRRFGDRQGAEAHHRHAFHGTPWGGL